MLLLLALMVGPPSFACAQTDLSDPDQATEAVGKALGSPNWYDRAADDFRPIRVKAPKLPSSSGFPNFWFWGEIWRFLFWTLLFVLLAVIAYYAVRAFLAREASQAVDLEETQERRPGDITRVEELPVALATSPDDYLFEAQRRYRQGDFGMAIVYLFSHQLLQLDRRHWLRLVKGKTNRAYLREVRRASAPAAPELAAITEQTMLLFEEVYFGKRLPPQGEIDAAWGRIDRFETLVAQTEGEGR